METILRNYNKLIHQFQDNKKIVEDYYYFMMTVSIFFHEQSLIISSEIYDYIFKLLIQELDAKEPKEDSINENDCQKVIHQEQLKDYYQNINLQSIDSIIVRMLNIIKNDLKNPTPLGEVILRFKSLENIYRREWISHNVDPKYNESIALHTMQMFSIISLYNNSKKANNKDCLDILKVYEMILVSEIAQSIVGDFAESEENYEDTYAAETTRIRKIFKNLKNGEYFVNLWLEFASQETKEAKLANEIDKLDTVLKSLYLEQKLTRTDIFDTFYDQEIRNNTFTNSEVKDLFFLARIHKGDT